MRFFIGLIVGVMLTIGTAYVADAMRAAPGPDGAAQRMVNWEVVSNDLSGLSSNLQNAWGRLVGDARELDRKAERART